MRRIWLIVAVVVATVVPAISKARAATTRPDVKETARAITEETLRPNDSPEGRPLPLLGHWNTGGGWQADGFTGRWQMEMIEQGHHLLPWFDMPTPAPVTKEAADSWFKVCYEMGIKRAAELKLPITLLGTQWESLLSDDDAYFKLPADKNPNAVTPGGQVLKMVCPFGPVELWKKVGSKWGSTNTLKRIQQLYPNPPLVMFLSNNEHTRLTWSVAENSKRYMDTYGKGKDGYFKRKVIGDGFIERYRALQAGIRDGLAAEAWRKNAMFVGYDAFGPVHFGRWGGWAQYSLITKGRIDPNPLMWDGGSPSFYTAAYAGLTDFQVMCPQIESMNWIFMQAEAYKLNPKFWFELSVWDGWDARATGDTRRAYEAKGQTFTPQRWGGQVQFGMWLLRPRLVREFRSHIDKRTACEPYFKPIMAAVDRVHENQTLREFWRKGTLVANKAGQHPYQEAIPAEYKDVDRWFLLDTDLSPQPPLKLNTEIKVFAEALVLGEKGERRWLVYAHSPLADHKDVTITVPGFGPIKVDVPVAGAFCVVDEKTGKSELAK